MKAVKIWEEGLIIENGCGVRQNVEVRDVVVACGSKPDQKIVNIARSIAAKVYIVGDCVKPRGILEAIEDGARIGRKV
jgi:purine-nucleoside phosphorylase